MKIVFMGTPEIAAVILRNLYEAGHGLLCAVTQPDRPKGRGKELSCSAVKKLALELDIPILQPERVSAPEFVSKIRTLSPDLIVVAAYGQLLTKDILDLPHYGCVNVHASLLPKYRGAAPIQWSIINGDPVTGVTIMYMEEVLDTGDMIKREEVLIDKEETAGSLHDKLAAAGGKLLLEVIEELLLGTAKREKQEEALADYVTVIHKSDGLLDFNLPAAKLERLIRGLSPWPSAYTYIDGKTLKFWKAEVLPEDKSCNCKRVPGMVIGETKKALLIQTADAILSVTELQLEGKKRMRAMDFLRGFEVKQGTILGREGKEDFHGCH